VDQAPIGDDGDDTRLKWYLVIDQDNVGALPAASVPRSASPGTGWCGRNEIRHLVADRIVDVTSFAAAA
jgi:hypothetical protein